MSHCEEDRADSEAVSSVRGPTSDDFASSLTDEDATKLVIR